MFERFHIQTHYKPREQQILNALLALTTGVLTLLYPDTLYLIAGGYLVALGILFMIFRIPAGLSAVPVVAGILIFIFPELIPVTFALFLGLFGFILLFAFHFSVVGVLTILIALLIFLNPDSVAYLIATFLLLYAFANGIRWFREWQRQSPESQELS